MRRKGIAILAIVLALPAIAQATPRIGEKDNGYSIADEQYLIAYAEAEKAGLDVGRNLLDWTWNPAKQRVSDARIAESTARIEGWLAPAPQPVDAQTPYVGPEQEPVTYSAPTTTASGSSNPMVNPACESGGDPQVVDPSGTYWGKYQFDQGTWSAHGGDPGSYGSASEAEQDAVAGRVTYDAWPNC